MSSPRNVALLGATGSIGRSALSVFEVFPERFRVVSMSAGTNLEVLLPAIARFRPSVVSVKERADADRVRREFPGVRVGWGAQGIVDVATLPEVDVVLGGVVGAAGLPPAYEAVKLGKTLALANKEVLVVAGEAVMAAAAASGAAVLPVDSEHCALHQALRGGLHSEIERLVLTASGGPFRKRPLETFDAITIEDALAHPTWKMGPKITIDSATMMNKGLEVIEARWLFDVPPERLGVVIHPQSIIHSMVEWVDGSVLAQMSPNDMRFPILYALTYPERVPTPLPKLDLASLGKLELEPLDERRFPAVPLAYAALRAGGTAPAVLNAANEVAVAAFLEGRIPYRSLVSVVEKVLAGHRPSPATSLDAVLDADREARLRAAELVSSGAPLAFTGTVAPSPA
ncbi:MAG: 1-deoxy-D-xylulose-5-phosphate reductoisomerase [Holophagales bacterium]|nr:1-deoxy-D-xylulose-5-phosphate reductoisomerase [Holophagales bacterium]